MTAKKSPYTTADRARWRSELLKKGQEVAQRLSKILGGKNATLATLKLDDSESPIRPEDQLRDYLDHLMASLKTLDTADFGKCTGCESYLTSAALNAMPWATRCVNCPEP